MDLHASFLPSCNLPLLFHAFLPLLPSPTAFLTSPGFSDSFHLLYSASDPFLVFYLLSHVFHQLLPLLPSPTAFLTSPGLF